MKIAAHGYADPSSLAFSPFYPALIRGLALVIGPTWVSALAIANVLSFLFPVVVYKTFGFRVALLAELFPTYVVFTTIPYSEALTLLLLSLSILLALRGRILASSNSLSLAIFSGYSLAWALPSFAIAFLKRWRKRTVIFFILPVLTGVLIFYWFFLSTGSFLAFFTVESTHWGVSFATPWHQISYLLKANPIEGPGFWPLPGTWVTRNLPFEAFYVLGALYILRTKSEHRIFLTAYSLSVILPLFFVIGTAAASIPRLMLPAFPIFITYATVIKGRYLWVYCVVCLSLAAWVAMAQTLSFFA